MDFSQWLSKLSEKWNSLHHGYTKLPSMASELPSFLPSQLTPKSWPVPNFRIPRSMRQTIIIGCVVLMITIAGTFHAMNSSFSLSPAYYYSGASAAQAQYLTNQDYCAKYNGKTADVHKILATLSHYLPDESQHEELLKEATGKGPELTHNTAVKAREYIKLFEPWAELHLSLADHHSFYSREDIVHYLHCQARTAKKVTGGMNESQVLETIQLYDAYRYLVTNMGQTIFPWTAPYFPDHLSLYSQIKNGGKGLVFTTGNNQVSYIQTSIASLRSLGCTLPIEVMYNGKDDLSADMRRKIEAFPGVVTRNLQHMIQHDSDWKFEGFDMKPFAILVSSFREAILVDADVGFLKNPEVLFMDSGYLETGTLFFYDRIHSKNDMRNDWSREALPKPLSDRVIEKLDLSERIDAIREDQESGVVVFDKSKHFVSLLMIAWLNGPQRHGPGGDEMENKGFYDLYYGDKDSYWFGMELVGNPNYSFSTGALGATGNLTKITKYTFDQNSRNAVILESYPYNGSHATNPTHHGRTISIYDRDLAWCSYQMIHMDRDQSPLWYNGWISDQKRPSLWAKNVWQFEHYMLEPDVNGHNPWTWLDGFKGCLAGREVVSYTDSEKAVFESAIQAARDLGIVKGG